MDGPDAAPVLDGSAGTLVRDGPEASEDLQLEELGVLEPEALGQPLHGRWLCLSADARDAPAHVHGRLVEDRYGIRSTIMTSQLPPAKWHDHLGDPTIADAVCERILHNAHRLALKGPSRRKEEATKE